ncbi:response regulator [bacterium]|nr:response regulator [bacterium]
MPLFVFFVGILITLLLASTFHQSELKFKHENLKSITREFYKTQNLILNNSILRIQSFSEISNLVRSKSALQQSIVTEIVSSTMFQRASLFVLRDKKVKDGQPDLDFVRRYKTPSDNMPVMKFTTMQSKYLRKKIATMLKENQPNTVALSHSDNLNTISLIWRSLTNRRDFIVFLSSLDNFFKDWPQDQNLMAVLKDQHADLEIMVQQDSKTKVFKFSTDQQIIADAKKNNKFLIFSQALVNENYGISIDWYENSSIRPSSYVMMIIVFGLTITLLTALFVRFILDQNLRIYKLVVSRTADLELAMNQAQDANMAKTRFLANMSHELRTPLNLILGMLELLQLNTTDRKNHDYLKNMQSAGEHLLNLITDLLSMSKEDASDVQINQVPINVPIFFEEIGAIIGPECIKKNLDFNIDISHDIPTSMIGDPVKLRQILLNLLRNSLKYTNTGRLSLIINLVKKESVNKTICNMRFQVVDTGVGIPKNKMNQIFDRFFQIEGSKMLAEGGVGLGLSIVKDLVSKMNGNITVASEVGKGSVFTVDIDLESRDETPWISQYQLTKAPSKHYICLILSNPALKHNLKHMLPKHTFEVAEVNLQKAMGSEVIALIKESDSIITDYIDESTINTLHYKYPELHIIALGSDFELKNLKHIKNIHLVGNTPIIFTPLFEALDFKLKRKQISVEAIEAKLNIQAVSTHPTKSISILAVDDDAGNRELLKAYLQDPQFKVSFAEDGREALEKFKISKPDLVIADLRMPYMNGFELAEAIYSFETVSPPTRRTPVILLTADALENTSNEAKKYSISIYLTKPIRKNRLIQSIYDVHNSRLIN